MRVLPLTLIVCGLIWSAGTMATMPGPLTDPYMLATGWFCFRSPYHPSKQGISAGLESPAVAARRPASPPAISLS